MNNQNIDMKIPKFLESEEVRKRHEQLLKEQERQQYLKIKNNNTRKINKKKAEMRKKLFGKVFVAGASFYLGVLSVHGYQQVKGTEQIVEKFYSYGTEYDIKNNNFLNNGVMVNGVKVSFDSVIRDIIGDARYGGMTDVEVFWAIANIYGFDYAKEYVGEVSREAIIDAKYNAYYESKLEEYTKNSGGMSK